MKKGIYVIVGIVVIVMLVLVALSSMSSDGTWDTPFESGNISGTWEEEITLEFADGSTESLKILEDNFENLGSLGVIMYDGRQISSASYKVYGTATGSGYTSCEVGAFRVCIDYYQGSTKIGGPYYASSATQTMTLNTRTRLLYSGTNLVATFGSRAPGTYSVKWYYDTSAIQYKGLPDDGSGYQSVAPPPGRTLTFSVVNLNQIVLNLESEVTTT